MKNSFSAKKYAFTVVAADVILFTVKDDALHVLLIKMKKRPFTDYWAAPGGLVKINESVDKAAMRILKEKTGISRRTLEQLATFGRVDRDPFGRVVSVAYMALVPHQGLKLATTDEHGDVAWFPISRLPKLAYDHKEMVRFAYKRLRDVIGYSTVVKHIMPSEFSLGDLQRVHEIILSKSLDKRNFRKRVLSLGFVQKTIKKQSGIRNRPAVLYRFSKGG